jgi:ribosomal protein S12 methylthiotransferase accessory factor
MIETVTSLAEDSSLIALDRPKDGNHTMILGKDLSLEETIQNMTATLSKLGIKIEIASWRNIVPNVWSVHIRDAASPMCFTNGKGSSKESALCSALGEYMERISCNYFYNDQYLGQEISGRSFVHYPTEKWFLPEKEDGLPKGILDEATLKIYNPDGQLKASHLFDTNSGLTNRGVCALPFVRNSDKKVVYFPVSLIGNLFVSNGMSAGNTQAEAHVQCLSEIFERAVKKEIIQREWALPDVPREILARYPKIMAGINELEARGFPVLVKDASLGGKFPVMCVTLMNPQTGGVFASFGAHPKFEVALERSLTELLQGRSFEGLNDVLAPTFNSFAVTEPNNFVEHFIDSNGVISWKFFSKKFDHAYVEWDFDGSTAQECDYLMGILRDIGKEVYVANYEYFGTKACRILVPNYSEIYPLEDLIWDNTNKSIAYREKILNIHSLDDDALLDLVQKLEDSDQDNYTRISDLIGIEFDENTVWGQLDIGELKILIYLALQEFEKAKPLVGAFLTFNDNSRQRKLFYQAIDAVLDIALSDDLDIEDFIGNMERMFGVETMKSVVGSLTGDVRFFGLSKTSLNLEGLDKHLSLIESYDKLHKGRSPI